MSFNELKLSAPLMRAVEASGFTVPTEIQRRAIPVILSGRDLMASAQTGTGKTAAFVLPILEQLNSRPPKPGRGPRVLILTPTRELATQVNSDIRTFSRFCQFTMGTVVGGVAYQPQYRLLSRPLDILVATPGRLIDHIDQKRVDFSRLEIFVLDEADRMLDLGFIEPVRKIAAGLPTARQTLLFSATLEGKVLRIAQELLNRPDCIQLAAVKDRHALIHQRVYRVDDALHKRRVLDHHLRGGALTQAVIFTATKRRADRLAKELLSNGHSSAALHGDMRQARRQRTLDQLRQGSVKLLVATDVAARGLDIKGMSHVINFDMPMVAEDYVHRIGRTGRAGAEGIAISLVGPEDGAKLASIERLTGRSLDRETVPGLEPQTPESRPVGRDAGRQRRPEGQGHRQARPGSRPFRSAAPQRKFRSAAPRRSRA